MNSSPEWKTGAQFRIVTRWFHQGLDRTCPAPGTALAEFPLDEGLDRFVEITAAYHASTLEWSVGSARLVAPADL